MVWGSFINSHQQTLKCPAGFYEGFIEVLLNQCSYSTIQDGGKVKVLIDSGLTVHEHKLFYLEGQKSSKGQTYIKHISLARQLNCLLPYFLPILLPVGLELKYVKYIALATRSY